VSGAQETARRDAAFGVSIDWPLPRVLIYGEDKAGNVMT